MIVAAQAPLVPLLGLWANAADLDRVSPASVGVSPERLQRIDSAVQEEIDAGRKAGAAVLIARRGGVVYEKAFGYADLERKTPLRTDAYFRMFSMTKPVISVALLMLYEEGRFQLSDPLASYIPAMKNVSVEVGVDALGQPVLEPPERPITIQDVFRHTSGLSRVDYAEVDSVRKLSEETLPGLPLLHHPGARWVYGPEHDVQAHLVEHFSGMPVDEFLAKRIFDPLGMPDSFYGEPRTDGPRNTVVCELDEDGRLITVDAPQGTPYGRFRNHPVGGSGLTMTLRDYARFSQMLLNGGELDGKRLLGRKTVELMTANHLPEDMPTLFPGFGYGLGVAVCISPAEAGNLGSVGQFGWGGYATTWLIIDPREELVAIFVVRSTRRICVGNGDSAVLEQTPALIRGDTEA
jgi:CubicO group peptidase (beta-lactamase class C family)